MDPGTPNLFLGTLVSPVTPFTIKCLVILHKSDLITGFGHVLSDLRQFLALSNALLVAWPYTIATVVCELPLTFLYLLHSISCTHGHQTLFLLKLKGVASKTIKTALSKNQYKIAAVTVGIILSEARSLLGLRLKKYGFTHIPCIFVKCRSCLYRVAFHC